MLFYFQVSQNEWMFFNHMGHSHKVQISKFGEKSMELNLDLELQMNIFFLNRLYPATIPLKIVQMSRT